jgi:dipeptidyl aminopeptidase/acylaminoacyl peptidase
LEVKYLAFHSEGLKLRVFLARPEEEGPFPTVLVNHGGGGMDDVYEEMCLELAGRGCLAAAMTFRGYPGSEGRQEYGKGEVRDLLNLVEYLKAQDNLADPARIGMFGYSRGALNTLLACQRSADFQAAVVWSAPVEMRWHAQMHPFVQDLVGGSPEALPEEYDLRSPLQAVEKFSCPLLIVHGEEDEVIPVEHAYLLAAELERQHKPFRLRIYPGEGHTFGITAFYAAWKETVEFLEQHLGFKGTEG